MNIQEENSARYFRVQSEREQTFLVSESAVSTLYVGLARTAPPTNTIFRLMFLLTRLQEALYEDLAV